MSALEKMREAFETCTVMAGVEPDFECIYITKDVANALFDEAEAENAKLRELVRDMWHEGMCECGSRGKCASCEYDYPDRMRELGVEA